MVFGILNAKGANKPNAGLLDLERTFGLPNGDIFHGATSILAATILPAAADDISGAGATFPYPIYAKWADAYKKETGVGLNYQSIGSGGGG